jgi:hypothetical protein
MEVGMIEDTSTIPPFAASEIEDGLRSDVAEQRQQRRRSFHTRERERAS